MRTHFWLSLAVVACAGGALVGCSSGPDLSGPTVFQFQGLTVKEADALEAALRRQDGLKMTRKDSATGTTIETTGIEYSKDFEPVLKAVREAAVEGGIELKFDSTVFRYSSLSASGSAMTTVTIEASRGAQTYIADRTTGDPWRRVKLDDQGRWRGAVQTKGIVSTNGGWLYIAFRQPGGNGLFRYARVNVLTNEQESTSFSKVQQAGLPEPVPKAGEAETPSEGKEPAAEKPTEAKTAEGETATKWKWPWQ